MLTFASRAHMSLIIILLIALMAGFGVTEVQAGSNSWRFVIFGDTRGDFDAHTMPPFDPNTATGVSLDLPRIATKIASLNPEFVLHVGDLVGGDMYNDAIEFGFPIVAIPYASQFQAFKDAVTSITSRNIPIYTVRGNHEVSDVLGVKGYTDPTLAAAYYQALGKNMPQNYTRRWGRRSGDDQRGLTYSFNHKQVTVVAVDQYSYYVPPDPLPIPWYRPKNIVWGTNLWGYHTVDQAWISGQLRKATTPFKIVFAHAPIFVATGGVDRAGSTGYSWFRELYFGPQYLGGQARRQEFVDMMGNAGVQLYAVGHVHNMSVGSFTDTAGHTMYQLTAGNGGAYPLDHSPNPGTPEPSLKNVKYEMEKPGFTLVTVNPTANTMLLEYYVMSLSDYTWSKESFTTLIAGASRVR